MYAILSENGVAEDRIENVVGPDLEIPGLNYILAGRPLTAALRGPK